MNWKSALLKAGNAALYLTTCVLVGTGLLLELRMDDEDGARRLLGMGADDWGEIHFAVALAFVGLAVLHLVLNWSWLKGAFRQRKLALLVVGSGVALVAAALLWPFDHQAAQRGTKSDHHQKGHD